MRLIRTASFRFAALYVLLFVVSAGILGGAVFLTARRSLQQQLTTSVTADMAFLQSEYARGGLQHLRSLIQTREREPDAPDYILQAPSGQVLAGEIIPRSDLHPGWTELDAAEEGLNQETPEHLRALVVDLGGGLLLGVGDDLSRISEVEEAIASAFAWVVGLAVILGIGGGVLLSQAFLARVDAIGRAAEAIIAGDLSHRIPTGGDSDFDRLAGTLNRMLDRINALMETLQQVSSDIAHDLRTPLSRLYQKLDGARENARSLADYEAAIHGALRDAEALMETFSALLRIAQVEGAARRAAFRDVDLSAVVDAVADAYRPDAEDAGHVILVEATASVTVHGDKDLLTQALANLIENGLRHTPAGTVLRVTLSAGSGTGPVLAVADNGPGVAPDDLPRLTQRFYRTERSRTTAGNGLGLSLVAAVMELHRGRVDLEAAHPGLAVRLIFPAEKP
ncbi:sensor histidine kinase [Acidisoma silvae]|uniref:histidine kinase n=1 Tax=Acidisoma silvae TaxID=2802396 RepID=A0A963YTC2_9PROT|nr:ATP-binding protein [Acidisoma silvae]MCB8876050.1 HAMP domain-containing protein [Acidisoma silvae]